MAKGCSMCVGQSFVFFVGTVKSITKYRPRKNLWHVEKAPSGHEVKFYINAIIYPQARRLRPQYGISGHLWRLLLLLP